MRCWRMRTALICLSLLFLASPAVAQELPNSLNMTCAAASALVRQNGSAVIATGPVIFERFVANQQYCGPGESTGPAWIQTRDVAQCLVGQQCRGLHLRRGGE